MEHSVLGTRWVYDACADPVYVAAVVAAILTGQGEAEQFVEMEGGLEPRESTVKVKGSGKPGDDVPALTPMAPTTEGPTTSIDAGEVTLLVKRVLDLEAKDPGAASLTGTWANQSSPVLLASLSRGVVGGPSAG
ncbi:hypothetical protein [Arthrobacter sp. NyZ413]|uniref:hypothetical protein n=1 Tax=Arthrobacter sp. NyZ413 TaxID=3144669 RepID=UPI002CC7E44C|nr:hypothetical protein [Arthrobacter sp.]